MGLNGFGKVIRQSEMRQESDALLGSTFKLCISVSGDSVGQLSEKAKIAREYNPDLVELRLDYITGINHEKILKVKRLLNGNEILTLRAKSEGGRFKMPESKRIDLIRNSILALKPRFVDIEILAMLEYHELLPDIEKSKTSLIASYHDLQGNKSAAKLEAIMAKAPLESRSLFAIKIVSEAKKMKDNEKVLGLYSSKILADRSLKLVAFCTGEKGVASRVSCLQAGSPYTYASLPNEPLAPGQLDIESMRREIAKLKMVK